MDTTLTHSMAEQDQHLTATILRERGRLKNFIAQRVPDPAQAEDILQDVFIAYVTAYRLPEAIELVGAWLYRVARNRIVDGFRKKREQALPQAAEEDDEVSWLDSVLAGSDQGPEAAYSRSLLLAALAEALDALPKNQRDVFIGHELEGLSFKQLSQASGVGVSTLLARKRYAVLALRASLQTLYDESK
jgi:RNA polymerase sigma factor (sigma-70 family)